MTTTPDIFTNVHKGLRNALFEACLAVGRATDSRVDGAPARRLLQEVLHFTRHHGDNEDTLLLPLLRSRAPEIAHQMEQAHHRIEQALTALEARAETAPPEDLHHETAAFIALYLDHMREEEQLLAPRIRAAIDPDTLASFGRDSVQRTAPADQRRMIGWMLPAMPRPEADSYLERLPPDLADDLRRLL